MDDWTKIITTYGEDFALPGTWLWWPRGLDWYLFIHHKDKITIWLGDTEIDTFRCRATSVAGRVRACRRWCDARLWVQPPLSDDLLGFVKPETTH